MIKREAYRIAKDMAAVLSYGRIPPSADMKPMVRHRTLIPPPWPNNIDKSYGRETVHMRDAAEQIITVLHRRSAMLTKSADFKDKGSGSCGFTNDFSVAEEHI